MSTVARGAAPSLLPLYDSWSRPHDDRYAGVIVATTCGTSTYYVQVQGQILGQQESGAWAYTLPDHLGSVRQLVGSEGQVGLARRELRPVWSPVRDFWFRRERLCLHRGVVRLLHGVALPGGAVVRAGGREIHQPGPINVSYYKSSTIYRYTEDFGDVCNPEEAHRFLAALEDWPYPLNYAGLYIGRLMAIQKFKDYAGID